MDNQSIIKSSITIYEAVWGVYFLPLIFLFTLTLLAIKSGKPAYVIFYAILGNFALVGYLPVRTQPIIWGVMVFSLFAVLWSFWASNKTE